jgi:hypothetical protein
MNTPRLDLPPETPAPTSRCLHSRLVDRVLTDTGEETGTRPLFGVRRNHSRSDSCIGAGKCCPTGFIDREVVTSSQSVRIPAVSRPCSKISAGLPLITANNWRVL